MQKYLKYSVILAILVFVALAILAIITDSLILIKEVDALFFALACLFFIISIILWVIPWAYLLKNNKEFSLISSIILGFSCVYGALTPIQVGAEALRSIKAKEIFHISYSDSISAAMIVKGLKFFFLGILAAVVLVGIILSVELSSVMAFGIGSGFIVIILAALLFLLPLNKGVGLAISRMFFGIGKKISIFKILGKYFENYSSYLEKVSRKKFVIVFFLAALSFVFEFIALWFCFISLTVFIELFPLLVLFVIISILERTPILPRGIGIVEAAGFIFLSLPEFTNLSLTISQIGAILILFDVVRLLVPTIISLFVSLIKLEPISEPKTNKKK